MNRVQTAKLMLKLLAKLPSKELIVSLHIRFAEEFRGDCRFCVKGLLDASRGVYRIAHDDPRGYVYTEKWFDRNSNPPNQIFMNNLEASLFKRLSAGVSECTKKGRKKLFKQAVEYCERTIARE